MTTKTKAITPAQRIESRILVARGHKVILDSHLAELYGVTTQASERAGQTEQRTLSR